MEKERRTLAQHVVKLREKEKLSWVEIGEQIERSASTARNLYDELKGEGAHYGLLPGKGGRKRIVEDKKAKRSTTKAAGNKATKRSTQNRRTAVAA